MESQNISTASYLRGMALLILLYIATGKLGLMLAVPPGYATVIWPPSGIALGMLIMHGRRLWPGVLIGSFLLNVFISEAVTPEGMNFNKMLIAAGIALGSTVQALTGRWLVNKWIGLPLKLESFRDLSGLFILGGPLACLWGATIGVSAMILGGAVSPAQVASNWLTWWMGDIFGVLVFMPLVLIAPGSPHRLLWRGHKLVSPSVLAMLALIMPLGLTFYAWRISSESIYIQNLGEFESLAEESEKALLHRLASYENALLGGEGFFQGSQQVSRKEWASYVHTINIAKNFPGMNGIGWVKPIDANEVDAFEKQMQQDDAPNFRIHPRTPDKPYYVISYLQPWENNNQVALGLNIAFEENRRIAAENARDSGYSTITKPIVLVQDEEKNVGFLLLHPMYREAMPTNTVEDRRAAFRGWMHTPLIAKRVLSDLTQSQGYKLNIRIYDSEEKPENLIYASDHEGSTAPEFAVRKQLHIMQRNWVIVWESTPAFEQAIESNSPLFILVGGLFFTGFLGLFLLVTTMRRAETMEWITEEHKLALPLAIFAVIAVGGWVFADKLASQEARHLKTLVQDEANKLEALLNSQTEGKLTALRRMAQRWEVAGGTSYKLWQDDAANYIAQMPGLKTLEWVDHDYRVRWVEPLRGNENVVGMDIRFDKQREKALEDAAFRKTPTMTPPLQLMQGYNGFLTYLPLYLGERFDGFIVGIFSIDDFFASAVTKEMAENFQFTISYDDKEFYRSNTRSPVQDHEQVWSSEKNLKIYDKNWRVRITPTHSFVEAQRTSLPTTVFIAGLLIAMLSALTVRAMILAKMRSVYLTASNKLNTAILSSAANYIIATDRKGTVTLFNKAAEEALGYKASEVIGKMKPDAWHDHEEIVQRAAALSKELGIPVKPGLGSFVAKAEIQGKDSAEWSNIRKDGTCFPVHMTVTTIRDSNDRISGYLGVVEDITQRKRAEFALKNSEETFRTAMESASIGMALVNPAGRWLKVNPALCELLGYTKEELLTIDFQTLTHPDDLQEDLRYVNRMISGEMNLYHMEKRYFHKSGRTIWARLSVSLVRHPDGVPNYFIAQIQDITEQKEVERIKSEFISIVSHELRTPLTSIRGSLGLILGAMAQEVPEKVKSLIDIAHKNCERLILLINDILDIDKIAAGQMRFDIKEESLADIVQQAVLANQGYAEKFNIQIDMRPMDPALRVMVDAARFVQVMSNLLSNAIKFSPPKSKVEVFATLGTSRIRIWVKDQGLGIPEEFRSRIFGKFSQADSSDTRAKGGSGLGLHIAKQMVESMKGEIGFETEMGQGTRFWVELPLMGKQAPDENTQALDKILHYKESLSDLPFVLHVEDDADLSNVLATALLGQAEILTATSMEQARHYLKHKAFTLVLLDIGMPDGSGLHLLEPIKAMGDKSPPVVILSADAPPEEVQKEVEAVMMKSRVSETRIIETILEILKKRKKSA